ncbi:hypothetical protein [Pseudomonas sp. URMO17WK12:I1]|uniref:hypothetical protein n=1 Tax=Pseudomonas sp. URMO17WK12:I1 TaxID=1261625 RepID=UPI001314C01B|nr:hypothetical protein [Pseudomonas sp. URMO17WK12:I1]
MHDESVPVANTAVFVSLDDRTTKINDSRIQSVNNKETSCFKVGCPYWVRVQPGRHIFNVLYTSNHHWNLNQMGHTYAHLSIEIQNMKPRHVYVARYREESNQVDFTVEDLGENPDFGITLGLEGANKKRYPVKF